ncbi:putative linoleate 13S-lipoxygenase [Helianthus annuus]|uniref:Lipoxygenase n=1 Tax=Helianthus annuus TaxID=4232 RepID=A0A251SSX4_HELAN|nr:lipoxygenase 2, chloroplastic [Helianthus annuus]KAF5773558.1 putative linoleate 13S-lipoxygenase [Helianthus annuus]KAJ0497859.1 putative linoleate 13S-lipoxygenase [Helianthus annuus]KAJ0671355.1 putative linoleate 13S-lipoxygenase [Helianthus annuus]KAJ0858398.1 putative linoleate 13S-lipoxygenase [Helianthus annuus]
MLKSHIHQVSNSISLPPLSTPFITDQHSSSTVISRKVLVKKRRGGSIRNMSTSTTTKATMISTSSVDKFTMVKGVISVQPTISGVLTSVTVGLIGTVADRVSDLFGKSFLLELVSTDLDSSGKEKETIKAYARPLNNGSKLHKYQCEFKVPYDFGDIGAVLVENQHRQEAYIKDIVLDDGSMIFPCESWVHSKYENPDKRIFFTDKSYLPLETPVGLKSLREKDLETLRGNGEGERKTFERIYDYDTYNDIGDPDANSDLSRPVLGGDQHPYPRRCRTGRPMTSTEPWSESRTTLPFYVPRDEDFSEIKEVTFGATTLFSVLDGVIPMLESILTDSGLGFSSFMDIGSLYTERVNMIPSNNGLLSAVPRLIQTIVNSTKSYLQFETPRMKERDSFSWFRDEEFCRQTLAGLNPYSIQLVTEWPLTSKLDPEVYGPAESAITKEIVEQEIKGFMTLEEALEQKKLFLLDYHDLLLPYVNKVRELEGTTLYGSRTLMFLTSTGTLRPLAIELTRPPNNGKPQWKHVYTPSRDATDAWLWKLAKAHVLAHDSGYHQLVSHWLRTHGATEPYIIATNRHLSKIHPIHRLLCPHLRYTMQINSLARLALINASGTINTSFSPKKYSMQLSSDAYARDWRFDHEALPADLVSRGMAVEDESAPHGIKLTIEDYPFANDGLLLWDAITRWATTYVNHYYPQPNLVESDTELQAWWTEIRTVGHGDKKDEPWWPQLKTRQDLIKVVTTIMWVCSGHHSAVNFGQYDFAGYFPNRPTIARTKMPNEDPTVEEWEAFISKPEDVLLDSFPTQIQATRVMSILAVLSTHSPDEEYIGTNIEPAWAAEPVIKAAFEEFSGEMKAIETIIDSRNRDTNLRNRRGAGLVPYELLKPFSEPGVTGKGVPYSISI